MQVFQEFSIEHKGETLYVRFIRYPNVNGTIDYVKKLRVNFELVENYGYEHITNTISSRLKKKIEKKAAELWDSYWTVDNVKSAKEEYGSKYNG